MTSTDTLTVEQFNAGLEGLKLYIDGKVMVIEKRIDGLETRIGGLETQVSGLETKVSGLETQVSGLETRMGGLETRMKAVEDVVLVNSVKVDELHHFVGWGFALMALFIAFIGCVITLAPMFRDMYRESRKSAKNEKEIRDIREELTRLKLGQ